MKKSLLSTAVALTINGVLLAPFASALTLDELADKLETLAAENAQLKARIEQLESHVDTPAADAVAGSQSVQNTPTVGLNHQYSYEILDATTRINRKQQLILAKKQQGELKENSVYLSGAATVIADYQKSNTESKFGYLMRHPTANNQRTKEVSEAVVHSAQLAVTANMGKWVTTYVEMLYDPEQSFGSGTTTDLNRNQVQVRRAYVMLGNLDESPFYASLGKMATPFGLTDTPNPFTASTVWHAFGGLAYGINLGYMNDGWNINVMGVQGGAQFRANNVPVDGTNIPSKLNNYTVDANYTFDVMDDTSLLMGASYTKGSPYCQGYPVTHFSACEKENGAYDVYAQLNGSNWMLQAEYAETEEAWAGTFNPAIPQFAAAKVESFDIGGRITTHLDTRRVDWSADFSRFVSGPSGSPWEKQDQIVLGIATFPTPSVKLFGEFIHTSGYAPLNFISGGSVRDSFGNIDNTQTHSDIDARSNILLFGANAAF